MQQSLEKLIYGKMVRYGRSRQCYFGFDFSVSVKSFFFIYQFHLSYSYFFSFYYSYLFYS